MSVKNGHHSGFSPSRYIINARQISGSSLRAARGRSDGLGNLTMPSIGFSGIQRRGFFVNQAKMAERSFRKLFQVFFPNGAVVDPFERSQR